MYLSRLYPTPVSCTEKENEQYTFGASVTAVVSGLSPACAERAKALWYRFSCDASVLNLVPGAGGYRFVIGNASCTLAEGDSYALHADASGVCVEAKDEASLMDGIKTLVQLICPEELAEGRESLYITAADIHDAPAMGFRSIHICVFTGSKLHTIEKAIHLAGFLKLTHVILEFWGTFPYASVASWKDRTMSRDSLKGLVQLIRSYGMEVIPMINHFGHASQSRGCNGCHSILDTNPRLSHLFEPDGWTWCLSNPDAYKLLADMRAEMMDFCGEGSYIHLGFDEAYSFATCPKCRKRAPHELLAEYINRLTEDVCSAGRRPILWHDELIRRSDFPEGPVVANGQSHNTEKALDLLDRRVIIADWQYDYKNGFNPTTSYFVQKGFDTVVCPWDNPENIRTLSVDVARYGACGIILTTWHHIENFLKNSTYWGNCAWSSGENAFGATWAENTTLLRRLYDADGYFEKAGWSRCEVEF